MNIIYSIIIAFSMYSRIPMPHIDWTKERMRYCLCYFPLVGAVIGGAMLLWMRYGLALTGNEIFFTAVLILIPIVITGGIHMDGFMDTSDALSSYKPMEEKLMILKDSHAGAFAILMCCCYFVLQFGVYSAMSMRVLRVLAVGCVLSRSLSGLSIVVFKKAKNTGLVSSFSDAAQANVVKVVMFIYIAACAIVMIAVDVLTGGTALVTAGIVFLFYKHIAYSKFGGTTGDLCGFFLQVCELAMAFTTVIAVHLFG